MVTKKRRHLPAFLVVLMVMTMIGCGTQVPSGHRAVFFSKFGSGTEMGKIYSEGFNWHMPWNGMFVYQIQTQERKESLRVLSSDGATMGMEVSVLYRPLIPKLDSLQITLGQGYYGVKVAPTLRAISRDVAGRFTPEEIYSTKRDELTSALKISLAEAMAGTYVEIQDVLLRDVMIPAKISEAINFKLAAEQDAQKMQFTIEKERREAERKKIEAKGISDFQKIVSAGITPSLLKWKGIEATRDIAQSPNSKVIIVGNDAGSLPVILSAGK